MNFWEFLTRNLPGWPSEKQTVMGTTFALGFTMLGMAYYSPALWNVELFKTLITVIIVTGCVNMILAFYFTANKSDEKRAELDQQRSETTGKAFDAITATAHSSSNVDSNTIKAGDEVTLEKV